MISPTDNTNRNSFGLSISDFNVQVHCNHAKLAETLRQRYRDFPLKDRACFLAEIDWVGKARETSLLDTQNSFQKDGLHFSAPGYQGFIDERNGKGQLTLSSVQPVEEIDYYLRVVFALLAHAAGGVLLHTAGIVRKGQAHLFFGHSGSGKTTVCRVSADDCTILNDDLILVLPDKNGWRAYGTPFWNPTQVKPSASSAPIAGMYLLVQAKRVTLQPLASGQATAALISNVPVIPQDPARSAELLKRLTKIQKAIPVYELQFLPDNTFWQHIPN